MLGNAVRRQTVINLAQAKSYALGLRFIRRATGVPVVLTGSTITFTMREEPRLGADVALTKVATIIDGPLGIAQLAFQASDTNVAPGEYTFTVTLKSSTNYTTPLMAGVVNVVASDETDTTGTYAGINPSTSLAVYLEEGDEVTIEVDKMDGFAVQAQTLMANFTADVEVLLADAQTDLQQQLATQQAAFNARLDSNEDSVAGALSVSSGHATAAAASAAAANGYAAAAAQSAIDAASTVSEGMPIGSIGQAGAVEIATVEEQLEGTRDDVVSTPEGVMSVVELLTADMLGKSLVDAKGDLLVASAADVLARLAVGTEGQVLTADPDEPLGMKWAPAAGSTLLINNTDTPTAAVAVLAPPVGTLIFMKTATVTQTWDFRGLAAMPAGWTARPSTPAPTFDAAGVAWSTAAGQGYTYDLGASGAAGDVTTITKIVSGTTAAMQGLAHLTGGGNGIMQSWYGSPSGQLLSGVTNFAYNSAFLSHGGTPAWPVWHKLRKSIVDNKWYTSYSFDGSSFTAEQAVTVTTPGTDKQVLFLGSTSGSGNWKVESVKATSKKSGGLLGWWDGAAIVAF